MKIRRKVKSAKNYRVGWTAREPTPWEIEQYEKEQEEEAFYYRLWKRETNRLIVTLLMQETNEHKGMTGYDIGKFLNISPGNVRKVLLELKKYDLVLLNETYHKKRKRNEYFMDKSRKCYLNQVNPYVGVDYEEEAEFVLLCLSERELILPEHRITRDDIKPYSDPDSLSYKIGNAALRKADESEFIYPDNTISLENADYEKAYLFSYGIAFNAIRGTIIGSYLTDVFGNEERIKELGIFPYPTLYRFYKFEEFIEDAQSLKNRTEVIDRMFFRKPKFFPDSKNGGNKS